MSQSKVTSYYVTRRSSRNQNNKGAIESAKNLAVAKDVIGKSVPQELKKQKSTEVPEAIKVLANAPSAANKGNNLKSRDAKPKVSKRAPKASKKTLSTDFSQSKVTSFYEAQKTSKEPNLSTIAECGVQQSPISDCASAADNVHETAKISEQKSKRVVLDRDNLRSPKRNLSNPNVGTPPKKKSSCSEIASEEIQSPSICITPKKLFIEDQTEKRSNEKVPENKPNERTPEKKLIHPSVRSPSGETKKAIANFKAKLSLVRSYNANCFKTNSIVSPTQRLENKSIVPTVPAYQKYNYLIDPEISSSLILPFKYKLLLEMFRSMDTVISILNNRKEKITFEKVKEGVQRMMKRTFAKVHLGQIMTVMPTAYDVALEKCTFKKANDPDYQLIITPKLNAAEGSNNAKSKNVTMTPLDLSGREQAFHNTLINIVKQHHKVFLSRLNFPSVSDESIKRWHPKFAVDSVPDIETATLPEVPENKVYTAKDVLNKIVKSSFRGKVVKALKSVADESTNSNIKIELEQSTSEKTPAPTKSALKGISSDLIAKIRARESAKILERMIESPDETKRKSMLERLPKIIQIVWHYFIAERKAAVPVDTAIEKIIHSCSSLSTHDEVKAHLTLITEEFPGWLSFIQIPKGLYITINKNKNITEMLDKFQQ